MLTVLTKISTDNTYNIYNIMWEASEEEDPLDPLSDAIFHPKPRGLILLCRRFVEMETLFVKILDNMYLNTLILYHSIQILNHALSPFLRSEYSFCATFGITDTLGQKKFPRKKHNWIWIDIPYNHLFQLCFGTTKHISGFMYHTYIYVQIA